jgi:hypothetical protein
MGYPSSLRNPPDTGAYGEQTLLMNEGTLGAGSPEGTGEPGYSRKGDPEEL